MEGRWDLIRVGGRAGVGGRGDRKLRGKGGGIAPLLIKHFLKIIRDESYNSLCVDKKLTKMLCLL